MRVLMAATRGRSDTGTPGQRVSRVFLPRKKISASREFYASGGGLIRPTRGADKRATFVQ